MSKKEATLISYKLVIDQKGKVYSERSLSDIDQLKKIQPKNILYFSADHDFDGIGIYERIELVHSYILSNYRKNEEFNGYLFLEKNK